MGHAGFKGHHFLLQCADLFLLFNQHRQQHHFERSLARKISAGRCMVAGGGKQYIERLLVIMLWLNVQAMQILYERARKQPYDLAELLEDAIRAGIETEGGIYTLVERVLREKTRPPAK